MGRDGSFMGSFNVIWTLFKCVRDIIFRLDKIWSYLFIYEIVLWLDFKCLHPRYVLDVLCLARRVVTKLDRNNCFVFLKTITLLRTLMIWMDMLCFA